MMQIRAGNQIDCPLFLLAVSVPYSLQFRIVPFFLRRE